MAVRHAALLRELHPGRSVPWGAPDRLLQQQLQCLTSLSHLVSITRLTGHGRVELGGGVTQPPGRWQVGGTWIPHRNLCGSIEYTTLHCLAQS